MHRFGATLPIQTERVTDQTEIDTVRPPWRWRSIGDRAVVFGQPQVFRQPPHRLEVAIPHHGLLARPDDGDQIGQLHRSQRRYANPQVDQAVGSGPSPIQQREAGRWSAGMRGRRR